MALHLSGYGGKQNTVAGERSVSGASSASGASTSQLHGRQTAAQLQNLKPGQTMNGEVVAKNGSEVQLQIDENTVITARLEKDINLAVGQRMTFEVKSSTKEQLALRPLFENLAADANGTRALQAAALPVNARTLSMVSALMEQGMSIDRQSLQNVFKDMMANRDSNPADVVALHKLQLPVNGENLAQIAGYRNFEHSMLAGIETIADRITETLLNLVDTQGSAGQAAALLHDILEVFLTQPQEGADAQGAGGVRADGQAAGQNTALQNGGIDGAEEQARGQASGQAAGTEAGDRTGRTTDAGTQNAAPAAGAEEDVGNVLRTGAQNVNGQSMEAQESAGHQSRLLLGRDGEPLLSAQQRADFAAQLEAAGVPEETVLQVRDGHISARQLLTALSQALAGGQGGGREALSSLLSGRGMQLLLQTQIENNWLLPPQKAAYKQEIESLYRRLSEQTGKLTNLLEAASQEHSGLAKGVRSVSESVDFLQQLNQNFTYVQLPLKMMTQNAHGDLYVYTNKKNLAKKDGNVSALLHLDMEHLGSMDIYVSMQQQKVSTRFCLQKEEMLDFLEANMQLLNERLLKRGYTMTSEVLCSREKTNVASEMLRQEGETNILSMFSFDVRA